MHIHMSLKRFQEVFGTSLKKHLVITWMLDGFLSNGLVFSSPACKILNKVLIYQSFLNSEHCKESLRATVIHSACLVHFNTVPNTRILNTS